MAQGQVSSRSRVGVLHVHSDYSHDGLDPLERLRDFAAARSLVFVGLTEHAEDLEEDEFEQYVAHCGALSNETLELIPGLEFRFQGFPGLHLLALGLTRWMQPRTPAEFIALVGGAAGLTIVAHPVLCNYCIPAEVAAGIDAVEVWNASYNTRYLPDPRAIRTLRELQRDRPHLVGVAGLDQHDSRNDRGTRVKLSANAGPDVLEALRLGRFTNVGRTMAFDARVQWGPVRLGVVSAARWAYDHVERIQDRLVRSLRDLRGGS